MDKIKNLIQKIRPKIKTMEEVKEINSMTPLSPFLLHINGYMRVEGPVRQEWIREIIKKVSIVIACHITSCDSSLEVITPYIYIALKTILQQNLIYHSSKDSQLVSRVYTRLNRKFLSLLSYLPYNFHTKVRVVEHRWEMESISHRPIIITYMISYGIEIYNYRLYDDFLSKGYDSFPVVPTEIDNICKEILSKIQERPINPNSALQIVTGKSGRLKKSISIHYKSPNVDSYSFNVGPGYSPSMEEDIFRSE